jgi:hypothetical protein
MADNFISQTTTTVQIPANTTLASYIDSRVTLDSSLTNGSLDAVFNTVTASTFWATQNGNGNSFRIGDDATIGDINISNTVGIIGIEDSTQGYVKFGTSGPLFGYTNNSGLPAAGTATTGSLLISGSHLYFYNGSGANGWVTVK